MEAHFLGNRHSLQRGRQRGPYIDPNTRVHPGNVRRRQNDVHFKVKINVAANRRAAERSVSPRTYNSSTSQFLPMQNPRSHIICLESNANCIVRARARSDDITNYRIRRFNVNSSRFYHPEVMLLRRCQKKVNLLN